MDDTHFQHHAYAAPDFRHQLLTNPPPFPPSHFPADSQASAADLFLSRPTSEHLEILMMAHRPTGLCEFQPAASAGATGVAAGSGGGTSSLVLQEADFSGCVGGDGSNTRWPRQETLTLLEIRSRLDSRFREANQKGPLWDEVSRIMSEENGYQRSGKKCREKFENLYKYYKKTKEGKTGRQDGKNYRFFRQLEALYGDHTTTNAPTSFLEAQSLANTHPYYQPSLIDTHLGCPNNINQETTTSHQSQKLCDNLSFSDYSSEFETSSSENRGCGDTKLMGESSSMGKKRRGRRSWKAKIKEFIDSKMRKVMEKQEAMVEKMMRTLEEKEQERMLREEEWRKDEIVRVEKEHKYWAQERAWIEARDVALMDALQNLTSKSDQDHHHLVRVLNHDVGTKGEGIERIVKKNNEYICKTTKENLSSRSCGYYNESDSNSLYNQGGISYGEVNERAQLNERAQVNERSNSLTVHEVSRAQLNDGSSPSNPNPNIVGTVQESCLRFLMNEGESLWENYGLKMNKGRDG